MPQHRPLMRVLAGRRLSARAETRTGEASTGFAKAGPQPEGAEHSVVTSVASAARCRPAMEGAAAWTRFIQPSSSIALSNPSVARWMSLSLPLSAAWTKKAPAASPVRTPEKCSWQVLRERVIGIKERFQAADRTTLWGNEVRELLVPVHRYPT